MSFWALLTQGTTNQKQTDQTLTNFVRELYCQRNHRPGLTNLVIIQASGNPWNPDPPLAGRRPRMKANGPRSASDVVARIMHEEGSFQRVGTKRCQMQRLHSPHFFPSLVQQLELHSLLFQIGVFATVIM